MQLEKRIHDIRRDRVPGPLMERFFDLGDAEARNLSALGADTTRCDQLFVQTVSFLSRDDQPCVDHNNRLIDAIDLGRRDPLKAILARLSPHLGAEKTQAHLSKPMSEMTQNHLVAIP